MNGKRLVIDASVALKWRLRDEEATSQADALLDDFLAGKLELLTPTLFDYEIVNALRVAVTRQRLSEADAAAALADFPGVEIGPSSNNKIVALLEGRTRGEIGARLTRITQIDGVIAANMVFEHAGEG